MQVEVPPAVVDAPTASAPPSRRPVVAGLAAGLWALLVGIAVVTCVVMVSWAVAPNAAGDAAAAWRASGLVWLAAHLVPLSVGELDVTVLPLGALALGLLLGRRAGRWAGRMLREPTMGEVAGIITAGSLAYGMGGAGIAWLSGSPSAAANPGLAMVGSGLVAAGGLVWGLSSEAGLGQAVWARMGHGLRATAGAALAASVGLFAAGSLLVTSGLVRQFEQVGGTLAELEAGPVGSAVVTLIGILSLPTLAIWGVSVVVGPGFQVGALGSLSAFGGQVDSLPALPVLAAVPTVPPPWAPVLLLVPIALGVLAGRIRWGRDLPTSSGAIVAALEVGALVGVAVAGMTLLASGSLGGGQIGRVGPAVLPVSAAASGLVVLGFLLEAGTQALQMWWKLYRADQRSLAGRQRDEASPPADARDASGPRAARSGGRDPEPSAAPEPFAAREVSAAGPSDARGPSPDHVDITDTANARRAGASGGQQGPAPEDPP